MNHWWSKTKIKSEPPNQFLTMPSINILVPKKKIASLKIFDNCKN